MSALGSRLRAAMAVLSLCFIAGCDGGGASSGAAPAASSSAPQTDSSVEITVIGTSDLHGRIGTLPLLGGYVRALRQKNPDGVVLVDAGDMFQGTLESNMNEGAAVIDAYKRLGYDAVAIGNHEFDYGPVGPASTVRKDAKPGPDQDARGALKARALQAKGAFPVLASNLLENDRPLDWPNVAPSVMVTRHGVSVGIIGVATITTPQTTISANVVGIRVTPLAETIAEQAKALREKGAKVVIVAAHAGGACQKLDNPTDLSSCEQGTEIFEVAKKLPPGAVQAIVGGHTHKAVAHEVAGIPIIQASSYGTDFGRVDLVVDAATGKVKKVAIHPPEKVTAGAMYEGVKVEPASDVAEAVAPALGAAKDRRAESLSATLAGAVTAKYREESALGNLITTLFLELDPKADIAVANGGGLRADLPAGPLTYGLLYDAFPFDNRIAHMTMTGRALKETIVRDLTGKSGILSLAGARVEARCDGGKLAVEVLLTRGKKAERKLKDEDKVVVITNEFLATGGDSFGPADKVELDEDGPPFREPVAALIKKRGGTLKAEDYLVPGKPRIKLPGPIGAGICGVH